METNNSTNMPTTTSALAVGIVALLLGIAAIIIVAVHAAGAGGIGSSGSTGERGPPGPQGPAGSDALVPKSALYTQESKYPGDDVNFVLSEMIENGTVFSTIQSFDLNQGARSFWFSFPLLCSSTTCPLIITLDGTVQTTMSIDPVTNADQLTMSLIISMEDGTVTVRAWGGVFESTSTFPSISQGVISDLTIGNNEGVGPVYVQEIDH